MGGKMRNANDKEAQRTMSRDARITALAVFCCLVFCLGNAMAEPHDSGQLISASDSAVIVHPRFGGQLLGYDIDRNGTEGIFSEFFSESGGKSLVATEVFDQKTGAIIKVVAQENETLDDFVTQEVNASDLGLVLFQHAGQNRFLTMIPLTGDKFTNLWTPPIKPGYQLEAISVSQGTPEVAAYESSFNTGLTFVFSSNIAKNAFGPQISLKPIINVDEFFLPAIAFNNQTNEAVLADSQGCPEPICVSSIALVNLTTGHITEFSAKLGVGTVNGLAVDPLRGIAVTTTLIDQGVEFYDLANHTGFEVQIPHAGSAVQAGLDVEFDPIHSLFLVTQYSSTGIINDPQPRVYVYDEAGHVKETITGLQRIPISPARIVLNPNTRTGFLPVIVEPINEALELQSFTY
jgi:hypothetical protein